MAFITPLIPKQSLTSIITRQPKIPLKLNFSAHPAYDVAAVSTYVAYFLTQYWTGEERRDVEFFAIVMGLFWNFTHNHDITIFILLWLIGGTSEFVSKSFLAGGNQVEYEKFRVGIKMGGYMSFLLLVFDLLDVLVGY